MMIIKRLFKQSCNFDFKLNQFSYIATTKTEMKAITKPIPVNK